MVLDNEKGRFQSTLPLRGATKATLTLAVDTVISIHAPLTGSDRVPKAADGLVIRFQSTLPLRGATLREGGHTYVVDDFNPRSPYGERPVYTKGSADHGNFNPRSPYGERRYGAECALGRKEFQSTLPLRGATSYFLAAISTARYFNPRSPYGERPRFMFYFGGDNNISIHAPLTGSDGSFRDTSI